MTNLEKIKETATTTEEMARKVWLAGLGAYGKGYDELTGRMETISNESNKLFEELVAKGQKLEEEGREKAKSMTDDVKTRTKFDAGFSSILSTFGLKDTETEQKLEELSAKIDALTDTVSKLMETEKK